VPEETQTTKLYADYLTYEGSLLDDTRQYSEAYYRLSRAMALNPWSARTQNAYAIACVMTGRRNQAIAGWQEAVALDPANATYRQNLLSALGQAKQSTAGAH
jgi:Flp pilus assembly protein TadD